MAKQSALMPRDSEIMGSISAAAVSSELVFLKFVIANTFKHLFHAKKESLAELNETKRII